LTQWGQSLGRCFSLVGKENAMNKIEIAKASIEKPTKDIIDQYIEDFNNGDAGIDEKAVCKVFSATNNEEISNILARVVVLNQLYSVGLNNSRREGDNKINIDIHRISEIIREKSKKIDNCKNEIDVINVIKEICNACEVGNYYKPGSFLSKYFSFLFADMNIPIMDSYVRGMIYYLGKNEFDLKVTQDQLKDYNTFCIYFKEFKSRIEKGVGCTYSYRDFDKYLWKYGKELDNNGFDIKIL
jgi:hypothetical protein